MSMTECTPQPAPLTPDRIAVRMADEGVPLRAIARTMQIPSDDLRLAFLEAKDQGQLIDLPPEDWPSSTTRVNRSPAAASIVSTPDEMLDFYISRVFGATHLEAGVLIPLLRRGEVQKEAIHAFIESRRRGSDRITEIKLVDVAVCKLRKKLKPLGIHIRTIWAWGFALDSEYRKIACDRLLSFINNREI